MTDTNQLPEPELGYIQTDKSNQPAFSARQMREAMEHALQARAQVQGEPSWWMRETDEGAEWTDTAPLVLIGWTPLYTAPQAAQAHHGITPKDQPNDLWCIHIPGPDEVHAAPSKEEADHMAAKHNAVMATYYASGAPNLECAPSIESVQASVIKWPHDQQSHADELREFDWAGWGIKPKEQA